MKLAIFLAVECLGLYVTCQGWGNSTLVVIIGLGLMLGGVSGYGNDTKKEDAKRE